MRLLTVISGILTCGAGIFCYAVYTSRFSDTAFLVGLVMVLSGILSIAAYLISGRGKKRLTDTAFVEGLVTLLYGLAVLNNQVTDQMLTMFFGTWLTLCGATRLSQGFYVSRFNPKDWSKIMPLAVIATMLGVIMMMPSLVAAVMPLMLVGGSFIVNGFSLLVYAMYMKKRTDKTQAELEAKARADARREKAAREHEERVALRSMTQRERAEYNRRKKAEKAAEKKRKKEEKKEAKRLRKEMKLSDEEKTIELKTQEIEEIRSQTPEEQRLEDEKLFAEADRKPREEVRENAAENAAPLKPVFKKPGEIPSLRAVQERQRSSKTELKEEDYTITVPKFTAVNLREIEEGKPIVEFEKVEMPEFKLESEGFDEIDRDDILSEIAGTKMPDSLVTDYTPLKLDDLIAEPLAKAKDPGDDRRFTQTLNFTWLEAHKYE